VITEISVSYPIDSTLNSNSPSKILLAKF